MWQTWPCKLFVYWHHLGQAPPSLHNPRRKMNETKIKVTPALNQLFPSHNSCTLQSRYRNIDYNNSARMCQTQINKKNSEDAPNYWKIPKQNLALTKRGGLGGTKRSHFVWR